jgi:hypothetical protein
LQDAVALVCTVVEFELLESLVMSSRGKSSR